MKHLFTLFLASLLAVAGCASYTLASYDSKIPISLSNERHSGEKFRHFRIERTMTWVAFDLIAVQKFELDDVLHEELPKAQRIINLRITSSEEALDSAIRVLGTLIQYALVTDRSLVSRRTIVIDGDVLE